MATATAKSPGRERISADAFFTRLADADQRRIRRLRLLDVLLNKTRLCLFGYGGKGRSLAHHIARIHGRDLLIFDSNPMARKRARAEGFAVVDDFTQIDTNQTATILGACQAQAEQAGVVGRNFIYYQEAAYIFDLPFLFDSNRAFTDCILPLRDDLYTIYCRVHPDSQRALLDVLCFRLSLDPSDLAGSRRLNSDMWFDQFERYSMRPYRTFLDVGAYDGDTLASAKQRLGVSRGIAVEANDSLFPRIEEVASGFTDGISILPMAAWSHDCKLTFEEVRGGMIRVYEDPLGSLQAAAIDSAITEHVDLVKMDIEGAELEALRGACRIFHASQPDLAIAAYHRPLDLIEFFNFLDGNGLSMDYARLDVAHYSDCFDDTILYCLRQAN